MFLEYRVFFLSIRSCPNVFKFEPVISAKKCNLLCIRFTKVIYFLNTRKLHISAEITGLDLNNLGKDQILHKNN